MNQNDVRHLPQKSENNCNHYRQYLDRPVFRLLICLAKTENKGSQPQEPFQESSCHYSTYDGSIDDLEDVGSVSGYVINRESHAGGNVT